MRRHNAVHNQQAGVERKSHQQNGKLGFLGNREGQGHQEHHTHLGKHGDAADVADDEHGPVGLGLTKNANKRFGEPLRAARNFKHLAHERAQREDGSQKAQGIAHALFNGGANGPQGHAAGNPQKGAGSHKRQKCMNPVTHAQHHDADDCHAKNNQSTRCSHLVTLFSGLQPYCLYMRT